jgi:transcriptional regulator with XRE-family HTH domain
MKLKKSRLQEIRVKKGFTVSELARKAEVSTRTINRIEAAEGNSKEETLNKVLNAINAMSGDSLIFKDIYII